MAIIVNLDIMMARRKISLGELAEKIDITPANLSILKTGKAKAIRFSTLEAICRVLDCQPGDILEYQADEVDGKIIFKAESDALIVKGIIALLIKVVSGHTPDEILNSELYFIDKIGLKDHLSPTRSNGLLSMVKQMRMYALAFKAKEAKG